jgi:hypothetical protein
MFVVRKCIALTRTMNSHSEVTNTISTVYTTLDYEYRHENKGTDLILVPRKYWEYK